jgi:thiol:disulfide interchange protein DsbD
MTRWLAMLLLILGVSTVASAQSTGAAGSLGNLSEVELLPPDEAFRFQARVRGPVLRLEARIAEGYYLYRDRLKFAAATAGLGLGPALMPPGETKQDPLFGEVQVYRDTTLIELPLDQVPAGASAIAVAVTSQGCADLGVCYPPDTRQVSVDLPLGLGASSPAGATMSGDLAALARLGGSPGAVSSGSGADAGFLAVDDAFRVRAVAVGNDAVEVTFDIAEGYYLYRSRMGFETAPPVTSQPPSLPAGKLKVDDYFGEQQVYYRTVTARVPVSAASANTLDLRVSYQGCADAGLCYPPQERLFPVVLGSAGSSTGSAAPSSVATGAAVVLSETDRLAASLTRDALGWVLGTFFLAGLLLSFTPCVLPMIPILSAIIAGQQGPTTGRRGFALALVYVLAMSLTYTVAGVMAGLFGQNLQAVFQHPAVLVSFSVLFVILSLAMFGFYELQLPVALQSRLAAFSQRQRGGNYLGVGVMGVLSALIVGPCVAAPLAAALIVIGTTGDPVRGGMALFSLSLGMGVPLLAVGLFGPALLPRAGNWMTLVRYIFGIMLLAVAIYLLSRLLPDTVTLALWAALSLLTAGVLFFGARGEAAASGISKGRMAISLGATAYAVVLAVGAATGANDPLKPLAGIGRENHASLAFQRVKSVQELDGIIAAANREGRSVMLDFYADWCVSCKEMERETFSDPRVRDALGTTVLVQADVTAYDDADQALLARFGLHGPPAILFFGTNGRERREYRVIGFMNAASFQPHVSSAQRS